MNGINNIPGIAPGNAAGVAPAANSKQEGTNFVEVLKKSVEGVNNSILEAGESAKGLATGQHANIHETMIALEKANISFRLMTKVQGKIISAYQEIMRMQI